ncbi:MAG: hypothetical protein IJL78_11345 [Lachnospiraceae bacterium]|nr:hypothetical protein [Lachnospiraceae bacterium]
MKTTATYFQNDPDRPLVYGEAEIDNRPRRRLRGEPEKPGILCESVIVGFCGTDHELMRMGRDGKLSAKFPEGRMRLINGHEGVVYVPSEGRFAIVLIRGGNSYDPTRYTEEETYFEYGCDQADGLFSDCNFYNPDMLLHIPDGYVHDGRIDLEAAKKLVFCDPYACMLFQRERMEDLGEAHLFRVEMAKHHCGEQEARDRARNSLFSRTVIFGLGTTGMFIGDLIRQKYPDADILFVSRSPETSDKVCFACEIAKAGYLSTDGMTEEEQAGAIMEKLGGKASCFIGVSGTALEHRIAFEHGVLGCNGIYNSFSLGPKISFDTMPFGFQNHLIFGSINFRQSHMEEAIRLLLKSRYNEIVGLIGREKFAEDPIKAYEEKIYVKNAPMKTAVIWNQKYVSGGEKS